ncbi:hypothetical protein [Puia sp.]|uniref:hypothetical protein n=1 Tax=Puia sp. TaxID=2045100 RepID=UPI002F3EB4C4
MYLLLRNNKQSGPHSLDEMRSLGLKAYDLVWVDGKSAAWRYPCEVEELKAFSPVVEEQPFDRFYKKTSPAKSAVTTADPPTVPGRRIIYVTMPAGKGPAVLRESTVQRESSRNNGSTAILPAAPSRSAEPRAIDIQFVDPPPRETAPRILNDPLAAYQPAPVVTINQPTRTEPIEPVNKYARTEPAVETVNRHPRMEPVEKLSQFQADWKNNVELTPPIHKRKTTRILQPLLVVACILALLAAGIFIGLSINNGGLRLRQKIAARDALKGNGPTDRTSQQPPAPNTTSSALVPSVHVLSAADSIKAGLSTTPPSGHILPDAAAGNAQLPGHTNPREKPSTANSRIQTPPMTSSRGALSPRDSAAAAAMTPMTIPVVHREAIHRTDPPTDKSDNMDKEVVRNNIANLVSVGTKGYKIGTFGGISGLQLTVSNRSVYPLDLVVVEVQYIQANKKTFKTENLYFRSIGPGSAMMQEAPKSPRGIKVQYKIILVNSKELGLSYSGI